MKVRAAALALAAVLPAALQAETKATLTIRGQDQTLRLYGPRTGAPVVVSSGDGGWTHLAPEVAAFLEKRGFSVAGFDCKHYLSSFTSGGRTLTPTDVPGDYRALVDFARGGRAERVLLVGVSEGAGLSVLAASDSGLQASLRGVLGLGLPDVNELAWRFSDSLIYITHKTPNEPTFKAADYIPKLGNVPLFAIHATHDEFVPVDEVKRLMALPGGPKKLVVLEAADHRFSDRQPELQKAVLEALDWMAGVRSPAP
jgi:alpha-beta hydrolase superfamily lysophospholipase